MGLSSGSLIEFAPDLELSLPNETSIFSELDRDLTVELIAVLKSAIFSFLLSTLFFYFPLYKVILIEDSGKSSPKHLW